VWALRTSEDALLPGRTATSASVVSISRRARSEWPTRDNVPSPASQRRPEALAGLVECPHRHPERSLLRGPRLEHELLHGPGRDHLDRHHQALPSEADVEEGPSRSAHGANFFLRGELP